jgi:hypothetical protein
MICHVLDYIVADDKIEVSVGKLISNFLERSFDDPREALSSTISSGMVRLESPVLEFSTEQCREVSVRASDLQDAFKCRGEELDHLSAGSRVIA